MQVTLTVANLLCTYLQKFLQPGFMFLFRVLSGSTFLLQMVKDRKVVGVQKDLKVLAHKSLNINMQVTQYPGIYCKELAQE